MQKLSFKNVGSPVVPQEIKRMRRQSMDYQRRLGEPAVHKHMWNLDDKDVGLAKDCPACFDPVYQSTRADCPVCFGTRLVSVANDPTHWIDANGRLTTTTTATPAPKYGGFGPGFLTWIAEPDAAEDFFKISDQGVLVRVQEANAQAPWYPDMNDNDLLINVDLGLDDFTIQQETARYQLKMSNPQTIRMRGGRGAEKRYQVGQTFQMTLIPKGSILRNVPVAP